MTSVLEPKAVPDELRLAQRGVLRRLSRVRRLLREHLLVEGLFWTVTAVMLAIAISLALDYFLRLNLSTRLVLLAIAVAAIFAVIVRRLWRPLMLPLDHLDLAEILNRRSPGVGQQISNVLQLPELLKSEIYASPSMVHAAVLECAGALDGVDLTATLNSERRRWLLAAIGGWIALALGFAVLWPATAELWARRWLAGSTERWPQSTYLNVIGLGDEQSLLVPRGEVSLLQFSARPKFAESAGGWRLNGRGEPLVVSSDVPPESRPPDAVHLSYTLADGTKKRGIAAQFDQANFRYELPPLAEPVEINISGGDDWLGPITIEPVDRPSVDSIEILAQRPGASQPERQKVGEGSSQLLFLTETQLELRLVANQPLRSAEVLEKGLPVAGWRRVDDRTYELRWTMKESLALEIRLVGERGNLSSKPYFLAIGLLKDREPRLTIRPSAGIGRRVTPVARIPLSIRATDDFGIAALALEIERTEIREDKPESSTARVDLGDDAQSPAGAPAQTELELDYDLELRERALAPGTLLKLRGTALDNCTVGAQPGNSRWLSLQVVSSDELFYEILMRLREQRAKFNAATEASKEQTKALIALATPEEATNIARAQQVINRQVWQVANQLDAALQEMVLNDLGNPQARDMLQSGIISPMRTLHGDLLTRLRGGVDALSQQQTVSEERRVEAQDLSEQAVKAMQTILAQMAQWESFVDVINQLKQIIQRQDEVLKNTEEIQKKRTNELFDE